MRVDSRGTLSMVAAGAVSERRARLWLRTEMPGPFTVALWDRGGTVRTAVVADRRAPEADGTMAVMLPDEAPTLGPLVPAMAYGFRITVTHTGALIGEGRFETAPATDRPQRFAFAFLGCHQPFRPDGTVHPAAARMLATLEPALMARAVQYVLCIGDQIYADAPGPRSMFHPTRRQALWQASVAEIRVRYQARYRQFWAFPEWRRLQACWPTWCMWDDHEIVNDWGARRAHQQPPWQRVFAGARSAFVDYQVSRTLALGTPWPAAFHYAFVWGPVATFVLDLSAQRVVDCLALERARPVRRYHRRGMRAPAASRRGAESQARLLLTAQHPMICA